MFSTLVVPAMQFIGSIYLRNGLEEQFMAQAERGLGVYVTASNDVTLLTSPSPLSVMALLLHSIGLYGSGPYGKVAKI